MHFTDPFCLVYFELRKHKQVGTTQFMPPEVILGDGYCVFSDVWALGIVAFEFVCGFLPFDVDWEEGDSERGSLSDASQVKIFRQILRQEPPLPSTILIMASNIVLF